MLARMRSRLPLLALVAVVVLAAVVARGRSALAVGEPGSLLGGLWLPSFGFSTSTGSAGDSTWPIFLGIQLAVWIVLLIPMGLLGVVIMIALVGSMRRRRIGRSTPVVAPAPDEVTGDQNGSAAGRLLSAARAARSILREHTGGPPSDAIVAAWLRLEEAAAGSGTRRRAHQTPTEFAAAVLAAHTMHEPALDELRMLYQRARFGRAEEVGPVQARAAHAALDRIMRALARPGVGAS